MTAGLPGLGGGPARIACVDVPELGLQVALRDNPGWQGGAVAVLERAGPQGEVVACNMAARRRGVTPGMRHAAALALAPGLQAAVVDAERLGRAGEELLGLLLRRAPAVEPGAPGVFWLDPEGLVRLFGDLPRWGRGLLDMLQETGFQASLVIGFHRHRAHALARAHRGVVVVADPAEELALVTRVPLARLDLPPGLRDSLGQLGIHHLGGFLTLPPEELPARFGAAAAALHARYTRDAGALRPVIPPEPITEGFEVDPPDDHCERLLFAVVPAVGRLLARLAAEGDALAALQVTMELDHAPALGTTIEPARALGDDERSQRQLIDLLRLRLGGIELAAPVLRVTLTAAGTRATGEQLALLRGSGRDLHAAGEAIARVRAAFGDQAVTRARLRPAHLPEAGFTWEPVTAATCPRAPDLPANDGPGAPLCRRVLARPRPLPAWTGVDDGRWLAGTGLCRGAVVRMTGPYRVSGGWWARTVERDYYFAETSAGDIAWVYHDGPRRRWFLHALVD